MGALPFSNLSIGAISQELVNSSKSLRTLSADAGKSTPDSMSEFRGYQLGTAAVNMYQNVGLLYDGCCMAMDSYGYIFATDPDFGGMSLDYGNYITNNDNQYNPYIGSNKGTFLNNAGSVSVTVHGRTNVRIISITHGYGASPNTPMYNFIDLNGSRVANANSNANAVTITYDFTATPGATYNATIGVNYGSV